MTPNPHTPAGHVVFERCPATPESGHGFYRAHVRGCICPGPSLEHHNERRLTARNEGRRGRRDSRPIDHVTAPPFWSPPIPEPEDFGEETRAVLNSDDAACKSVDPEIFFPVGTGGDAKAQVKLARYICQSCPLLAPCGRAVLERPEEHGVWAGMTPEERRRIRATRFREAVAA